MTQSHEAPVPMLDVSMSTSGLTRDLVDETPFVLPREQMGFGILGIPVLDPSLAQHEFDIPEAEKQQLKVEVQKLPLDSINAIVQARWIYRGIKTLADAIEKAGFVINTPLVARLDKENAQKYLEVVYKSTQMRGGKKPQEMKISDLVVSAEDGKPYYYVLIAGHRRIKAQRSRGVKEEVVKVVHNIDPLFAREIQMQENTYKPPEDHERAESHGELWTLAKLRNPELTYKSFAKRVGVTETELRRDLRFYRLPDRVKEKVIPQNEGETADGETITTKQSLLMPFAVACQLGRLVEEGASEHDILMLAGNLYQDKVTSEEEARRRVSAYIHDTLHSDNQNMLDIFGANITELNRVRRHSRVARRWAKPVDEAILYMRRVRETQILGLTDSGEDALSAVGVASKFRELAELMDEVFLPSIQVALNGGSDGIQRTIDEVRETTKQIDKRFDLPDSLRSGGSFLAEGVITPISEESDANSDSGFST